MRFTHNPTSSFNDKIGKLSLFSVLTQLCPLQQISMNFHGLPGRKFLTINSVVRKIAFVVHWGFAGKCYLCPHYALHVRAQAQPEDPEG